MAKKKNSNTTIHIGDIETEKKQLQQKMARTRESLAGTVGEIKETVEEQIEAVKDGVSSVLNYRDEFQKDPLVWSLGALSAGFALGYSVGYAHKNAKGTKQKGEIAKFADTMLDQLSGVGQSMVLPALDAKLGELFGVDFSSVLTQIGRSSSSTKRPAAQTKRKAPAKKKSTGRKS